MQKAAANSFFVFDKGKTGLISKKELLSILTDQGDEKLGKLEIDEIMDNLVFDANDNLDYNEFIKVTFDIF